ncbi:MAG: hypothetical protein LUM44_09860 [Pyrinomonadaceae bacterium]|nr:hypothetical protein [Pyrinomonadaceae bacterium]
MEKTVIVALITGISALFVAVISLIATLINSRNAARTAENIERLKNDFTQSNRVLDILDTETRNTLTNLKNATQAIQKLRDAIKIFKNDKESAIATGILDKISEEADNIISIYSESKATLAHVEDAIFHRTKNRAIDIKGAAQNFSLKVKKYKKADLLKGISEKFDIFDSFESDLHEFQQKLWVYRSERILSLTENSSIPITKI